MCVPTVPKSVATFIFKDVAFAKDFVARDILNHALDRKRIVDSAEGICKYVELARCKLRRNIVCKTGPEKCQMARVVDFKIRGRDVIFREKVHTPNLYRILFASA